jgi:hypothetical protein
MILLGYEECHMGEIRMHLNREERISLRLLVNPEISLINPPRLAEGR